jgi:hypothetical protein
MAKNKGKAAAKRKPIKSVTKQAVPKQASPKPALKPQVRPSRFSWARYKKPQQSEPTVKLPSTWHITRTAALTLWRHKSLFIGILLVYGLLNVTLAQALSGGTDVTTLKHTLSQASKGPFAGLTSGISIFVNLVGTVGNGSSSTSGSYQFLLGLIASLAIIWALRQVLAGGSARIRDTYYRGMYPLIPFILVLVVIGAQLIPFLLGSTVYSLVITNGIAVLFIEKLIWTLLYVLLTLWSLYMVSASLFAIYIVTLPDMTPIKALRSARELVRYRRWVTLSKILYLPLMLLVAGGIIMLPIIVWLTFLATFTFFLLTTISLLIVHAYMYTLYRELINE